MAALGAAIHAFPLHYEGVGGRAKPGHDEAETLPDRWRYAAID
jgi:hypothetical protein